MARRSEQMTREIASTYAERLRAIREQLGISQAKMGARLGVLSNQVSRYERSIQDIPEPTMRLAESFVALQHGRKKENL